MHAADDILNFGVDTGANESGHKPAKKAAMLTQRIEEKFNYQTAQRLQETHLLELALAEIQGKCMWFPVVVCCVICVFGKLTLRSILPAVHEGV